MIIRCPLMSLTKWVSILRPNGTGVSRGVPSVFYLDWKKRETRWLSSVPPGDLYKTYIKWNDYRLTVCVCTDRTTENLHHIQPEITYTNVAYLKSHLQKCVRRMKSALALKTFRHFFSIDPIGAIRRLSVIMVEDVTLMKSIGPLIWFTAALSKDYQLTDSQVCWLYGLVKVLSEYPQQDILDQHNGDVKLHRIHSSGMTEEIHNILVTLQFRMSYGGMKGDQRLFNRTTMTVLRRLNVADPAIPLITPPRVALKLEEWLLAGLDFHCVTSMVNILMDKYDDFTEDQIRAAIWHCSSSYNPRPYLPDDPEIINAVVKNKKETYQQLFSVWCTIARECRSLCKYYLNRNY